MISFLFALFSYYLSFISSPFLLENASIDQNIITFSAVSQISKSIELYTYLDVSFFRVIVLNSNSWYIGDIRSYYSRGFGGSKTRVVILPQNSARVSYHMNEAFRRQLENGSLLILASRNPFIYSNWPIFHLFRLQKFINGNWTLFSASLAGLNRYEMFSFIYLTLWYLSGIS